MIEPRACEGSFRFARGRARACKTHCVVIAFAPIAGRGMEGELFDPLLPTEVTS